MGDIEKCRAGLLCERWRKLDLHGPANLLVERGKRLIEQKHARRRCQRASQRHPLLLAAAEIGYALVGEAGEADKVDHLGDAPADLRTRHPARTLRPYPIFSETFMWGNTACIVGTSCRGCVARAASSRHPFLLNLDLPRIRGDQAGDHACRIVDFPIRSDRGR